MKFARAAAARNIRAEGAIFFVRLNAGLLSE